MLDNIRTVANYTYETVKKELIKQAQDIISSNTNGFVAIIEGLEQREQEIKNELNLKTGEVERISKELGNLTTSKQDLAKKVQQISEKLEENESREQFLNIQLTETIASLSDREAKLNQAREEISLLQNQLQEIHQQQLEAQIKREQLLKEGRTLNTADSINLSLKIEELKTIERKYAQLSQHSEDLQQSVTPNLQF